MIETTTEILIGAWQVLTDMAPYLLLGFLIAGILSVMMSPERVERHLGGAGLWPAIKASLFGVPLPLCSCGVIPVSASLRLHRASKGATTSFLISTPQTGVDSIAVTYSLLGPLLAIFRPVVAFLTGVLGGALVSVVDPEQNELPEAAAEAACEDGCCGTAPPPRQSTGSVWNRASQAIHYGFVTLPADLSRAMLAGILIAGIIGAVVPERFFSELLGCGIGSMLAMMVVGLPLYVCATASVPIAAAMVAKGVCPGAAIVFLISGPATNAATVTTIWKVMGRRTAVVYLLTMAGSALGAGLLVNVLFGTSPEAVGVPAFKEHAHAAGGPWSTIAALALLAVLLRGIAVGALRRWRPALVEAEEAPTPADKGEPVVLTIEGMTCSHCQATVQRGLSEVPGVLGVEVSLEEGRAVVRGQNLDPARLVAVVESLGYAAEVRGSQPPGSQPPA